MKSYACYDSVGRYVVAGVSEDDLAPSDIPDGCSVFYGDVSITTQYHDIATDTPTDKGEPPEDGYTFDYSTKTWVPNIPYLEYKVKAQREQLLLASDWTQIPNGPLTSAQQTAWATYRQELRDITSQSGYPTNVVWPTPPA